MRTAVAKTEKNRGREAPAKRTDIYIEQGGGGEEGG
jgi:hypothetical protein